MALELGLQISSFDRAARAYHLAVGQAMSPDSIRRISEGEGAKLLAMRAAEVAQAHDLHASPAPMVAPHNPITEQASLSTDGVLICIRAEEWKEVKLCAISQVTLSPRRPDQVSAHHPEHEPVIELSAHSYQATLGDADEMARWQYAEGLRRGLPGCRRLSSVNDGAPWIERITQANFPQAIQIVDWAHAAQRIHAAAEHVWGAQTAGGWAQTQLDRLWAGQATAVAEAIAALPHPQATAWAGYFANHAQRMHYADFRAQGLPIGSGSVESAGKTVIQHRLKRPGRGWVRPNAQAMIAALCELHSNRLDVALRQCRSR